MKLGALALVCLVAACGKDPPAHGGGGTQVSARAPAGKERGDCIPAPRGATPKPQLEAPEGQSSGSGSNFVPPGEPPPGQAPVVDDLENAIGSCDPGLMCLSNVCVRPPPADCQSIADQLASFELGNYAELEERTPVVRKYKAACAKGMVSKEQGECIAKATDKHGAFQCAPLMFPELAVDATASDICSRVVAVTRGYMLKSAGSAADPQMMQMFEQALVAMKQSCAEDGWPLELKQCILSAGDNIDAMSKCNAMMPPETQKKLTDRMMKMVQPTPPPPPPMPSP